MRISRDKTAGLPLGTVPPFVATCRAETVPDNPTYSRCLVEVNVPCPYRAAPFNLGYYCLHPNHKEIAARTAAELARKPIPAKSSAASPGVPPLNGHFTGHSQRRRQEL